MGTTSGGRQSETAPLSCRSLTHRLYLFTQQDDHRRLQTLIMGFMDSCAEYDICPMSWVDGSRNSIQALFLEKWAESVQQQGGKWEEPRPQLEERRTIGRRDEAAERWTRARNNLVSGENGWSFRNVGMCVLILWSHCVRVWSYTRV